MAQLVSLAAVPPAAAQTARPPAARLDARTRLRLAEMAWLEEDAVARWEDDGGAVLVPAEVAA